MSSEYLYEGGTWPATLERTHVFSDVADELQISSNGELIGSVVCRGVDAATVFTIYIPFEGDPNVPWWPAGSRSDLVSALRLLWDTHRVLSQIAVVSAPESVAP